MDDRPMWNAERTNDPAGHASEAVGAVAKDAIAQVKSASGRASDQARDLARRARDQAAAAGGALYRQGAHAGDYVAHRIGEYPLIALMLAGAIGYGLSYLIHSRSS